MPAVAYQPVLEKEPLCTLDEFLRMDFDEKVELVEGKVIHMGWNNFTHGMLIMWLGRILGNWSDKTSWGWISGGDTGVLTKQNPDSARGADIACISFERYAKVKKKGKIIDVGPELLIEVVSPSNTWNDIQDKVAEYFAIGTDEVWVISPKHRSVTTYESSGTVKAFDAAKHEFVTTQQLPDFQLPLAEMAKLVDEAEPGEE